MFDSVKYRATDGHLVATSTVDEVPELWMGPSGASLRFGDQAAIQCPWDWYVGSIPETVAEVKNDSWRVTSWTSAHRAPAGIGFQLTGAAAEAARPLDEEIVGMWRSGTRIFDFQLSKDRAGRSSVLLPFITLETTSSPSKQRETLHALCRVLAEEPSRQAMLGDPTRAARLADDMNAIALGKPGAPKGTGWWFSPKEWAVWKALGRTAHAHRFLRPLAGVPPVPVHVLAAAVREELAADPKAAKRVIDDARLEELLQRFHYVVEPWPFAALV